jgi:large subunit ribosomal protein L31
VRTRLWHTGPLAPVHVRTERLTAPAGDPAAVTHPEELIVKSDIHPAYVETQATCTCGNTFTTRSTEKSGQIHAEVCSQCHPFYTGKQKILDTGGRVARFEKRFGKTGTGSK